MKATAVGDSFSECKTVNRWTCKPSLKLGEKSKHFQVKRSHFLFNIVKAFFHSFPLSPRVRENLVYPFVMHSWVLFHSCEFVHIFMTSAPPTKLILAAFIRSFYATSLMKSAISLHLISLMKSWFPLTQGLQEKVCRRRRMAVVDQMEADFFTWINGNQEWRRMDFHVWK
jgi:hypothetical protein